MNTEEELQHLTEKVTRIVCGDPGIISREDASRLEELEFETGKRWDAVNQTWQPLCQMCYLDPIAPGQRWCQSCETWGTEEVTS